MCFQIKFSMGTSTLLDTDIRNMAGRYRPADKQERHMDVVFTTVDSSSVVNLQPQIYSTVDLEKKKV